jgi:hypothetical protein
MSDQLQRMSKEAVVASLFQAKFTIFIRRLQEQRCDVPISICHMIVTAPLSSFTQVPLQYVMICDYSTV